MSFTVETGHWELNTDLRATIQTSAFQKHPSRTGCGAGFSQTPAVNAGERGPLGPPAGTNDVTASLSTQRLHSFIHHGPNSYSSIEPLRLNSAHRSLQNMGEIDEWNI